MVPTNSEYLRSSLLQVGYERAAHPDLGLSKLRGLIWEAPKHRDAEPCLGEWQDGKGLEGVECRVSTSDAVTVLETPKNFAVLRLFHRGRGILSFSVLLATAEWCRTCAPAAPRQPTA